MTPTQTAFDRARAVADRNRFTAIVRCDLTAELPANLDADHVLTEAGDVVHLAHGTDWPKQDHDPQVLLHVRETAFPRRSELGTRNSPQNQDRPRCRSPPVRPRFQPAGAESPAGAGS